MNVSTLASVLCITLGLTVASGVCAESVSTTPTSDTTATAKASQKSIRKADHKLGADVRRALSKTRDITATNIFVRARSGVVTLTGSVPESAQITRAEEIARGVAGVTSVNNELSLQPQNYQRQSIPPDRT